MTNRGGRGKKSIYKTTHSRIPENIKIVVDSVSSLYKQYVEETGCLEFDSKNLLPSIPAIYIVFNESKILYVGQTKNLANRWKSHHLLKTIKLENQQDTVFIAWLNYDDINLLTTLEKLLIEGLEPELNSKSIGNPNGNESSLVKYKSKWKSGKTKNIRVPIAIADRVLEFAHQIDESYSTNTDEWFDRKQVKAIVSKGLSTPTSRGGQIKNCLAQLGNLLGFQVERGDRNKWIIFDTSDTRS